MFKYLYLNIDNPVYFLLVLYLLAIPALLILKIIKKDSLQSSFIFGISLFNIVQFISVSFILNRFPGATMGETFLLLSLLISIYLVILQFRNLYISFHKILFTFSGISLLISILYFRETSIYSPLPKDLNNNFWIIVHVLSIISGYALIFISSILSHSILILNFLNSSSHSLLKIVSKISRLLDFGAYFILFGTILGALWAKVAWGRYWAWDPKEVAVLVVIIWLFIIKFLRIIKPHSRGVVLFGGIMTFILIMVTWVGINLLKIGIHSYGFSNTGAIILTIFAAIEMLFFLMFLIEKATSIKIELKKD